jgi:hypothetical protein
MHFFATTTGQQFMEIGKKAVGLETDSPWVHRLDGIDVEGLEKISEYIEKLRKECGRSTER